MLVHRTLSLLAIGFVMMLAVAAPASATSNYPATGGNGGTAVEGTKTGNNTGVQGTETGQVTSGIVTSTGVGGGDTAVEGTKTGNNTGVQGTKTGQVTSGSVTPTGGRGAGVGGAGLARTGGDLTTLWLGVGLLAAGAVIVTVSRNRRKVPA